MLCLRWGFYLNASDKDLGSDDLNSLAKFIDERSPEVNDTSETQDLKKKHPQRKENDRASIFVKDSSSQILPINYWLS